MSQQFKLQRLKYQTINAFSHKPHFLCILTLLIFAAILTLHIIYIFTPIISGKITSSPILYVLLGLHFLLLILIVYDYVWLLVHDPVDRLVYDPQLISQVDSQYVQKCYQCNTSRYIGSHHCSSCGRCTQQFDHHCRFLNNCIGSKNYQKFIRILMSNIVFLSNIIGQGAWVFIRALNDQSVKSIIPRFYWVIIIIFALCAIVLVLIAYLLGFHCFLSYCLQATTIDYLLSRYKKKSSKTDRQQAMQSERQLR